MLHQYLIRVGEIAANSIRRAADAERAKREEPAPRRRPSASRPKTTFPNEVGNYSLAEADRRRDERRRLAGRAPMTPRQHFDRLRAAFLDFRTKPKISLPRVSRIWDRDACGV